MTVSEKDTPSWKWASHRHRSTGGAPATPTSERPHTSDIESGPGKATCAACCAGGTAPRRASATSGRDGNGQRNGGVRDRWGRTVLAGSTVDRVRRDRREDFGTSNRGSVCPTCSRSFNLFAQANETGEWQRERIRTLPPPYRLLKKYRWQGKRQKGKGKTLAFLPFAFCLIPSGCSFSAAC